jgi:hypothetical protein
MTRLVSGARVSEPFEMREIAKVGRGSNFCYHSSAISPGLQTLHFLLLSHLSLAVEAVVSKVVTPETLVVAFEMT